MVVDLSTHYAKMEQELVGLLQKVAHMLTPSDLAEATEYLAAREYGLALEEIVEGLAEQHPDAVLGLAPTIGRLAQAMQIEDRPFVKALPPSAGAVQRRY
jgi:hypothetical protein